MPSIAETVPGVQFGGWFTVAAPAGTPIEIIQGETAEFLKLAGIEVKIRSFGWFSSGAGTPYSSAEFIRGERKSWAGSRARWEFSLRRRTSSLLLFQDGLRARPLTWGSVLAIYCARLSGYRYNTRAFFRFL